MTLYSILFCFVFVIASENLNVFVLVREAIAFHEFLFSTIRNQILILIFKIIIKFHTLCVSFSFHSFSYINADVINFLEN